MKNEEKNIDVITEENNSQATPIAPKEKPKKALTKLKNKNFAKRNTFSIVLAVVFALVLVAVNILSVVIAQKLPTTIDVTTDKANSLTKENIEFIKGIEQEVEIIVCATREDYTGATMVSYAFQNYNVQENETADNYFNQTVTIIENYARYNSNFKVSFVDTQSPTFDLLEQDSSLEISYGDIIVRCIRDNNGKKVTNSSVITFEDIYELYDPSSGYGSYSYGSSYYQITASNIENELSSAVYTVASSERGTIAVLSGHSTKGSADYLLEALEGYNFETIEISGFITKNALDKVDVVLLTEPTSDLTAEELNILDAFLDNDGKRGKSFLTFGNTSSPATPNLNQFMEEWGIIVEDGMAYETEESYRVDNAIALFNKENDYTVQMNESDYLYLGADNVALSQGFETSDNRTCTVLMQTSETAVIAPKGTKIGWNAPQSLEKGAIPTAIVTKDTTYSEDDDYDELTSYVGYFASSDFISSEWSIYSAVGNLDYTINVINSMTGRADMYFTPKITGSYYVALSDSQKSAVTAVTLWVIPVIVLVGGVFVWIWRRNR